jgi:hypothetical protein
VQNSAQLVRLRLVAIIMANECCDRDFVAYFFQKNGEVIMLLKHCQIKKTKVCQSLCSNDVTYQYFIIGDAFISALAKTKKDCDEKVAEIYCCSSDDIKNQFKCFKSRILDIQKVAQKESKLKFRLVYLLFYYTRSNSTLSICCRFHLLSQTFKSLIL